MQIGDSLIEIMAFFKWKVKAFEEKELHTTYMCTWYCGKVQISFLMFQISL